MGSACGLEMVLERCGRKMDERDGKMEWWHTGESEVVVRAGKLSGGWLSAGWMLGGGRQGTWVDAIYDGVAQPALLCPLLCGGAGLLCTCTCTYASTWKD